MYVCTTPLTILYWWWWWGGGGGASVGGSQGPSNPGTKYFIKSVPAVRYGTMLRAEHLGVQEMPNTHTIKVLVLVPLEKERGTCTPSSLCVCTTYCTPWSEINKTSLPIHNITPMFIWSYVYVFLLIFCHMDLIKFNLFGVDGKTMWTFSNFQWITHIVHSIKEKGTDSSMTVTLESTFFHSFIILSLRVHNIYSLIYMR
jgi:hypothetical protein